MPFVNGAVVINGAPAGCVTVNLGRISKGSSTRQDPGIINDKARLYTQISLILISNEAGLGISPLIKRKNISYLDSTISIDETVFINTGSIAAKRSLSLIVALILTDVIILISSKNFSVNFIRKK